MTALYVQARTEAGSHVNVSRAVLLQYSFMRKSRRGGLIAGAMAVPVLTHPAAAGVPQQVGKADVEGRGRDA
jgi:hypothetical protein